MIEFDQVSKAFRVPGARQGLRRTWADVMAVQGLSFCAHDAGITGLLGPNGAGKTTALRLLGGLLPPDQGQVRVDGLDVAAQPLATRARLGIMTDGQGLYPRLTARENVLYFAGLRGMAPDEADFRLQNLTSLLRLERLLDRRTEGFSQGERMLVSLARALIHDPHNVVLDEPTNGLDVLATRALREVLRWLATPEGGGKCIVFSSHIMQEVEALCDHVGIVVAGRVVAQGSVADLTQGAAKTRFEDAFVHWAYGDNTASAVQEGSS